MDTLDELRALSRIIQDSIEAIDSIVKANNVEFPSPHTPFTVESEKARALSDVQKQSALIIAAAMQLVQSVRSPTLGLLTLAMQVDDIPRLFLFIFGKLTIYKHTLCSALNTAVTAHVAEVCRDAGPKVAFIINIIFYTIARD